MSALPPNSDRKSGHPQNAMSALPLEADVCGANRYVRFGPIADIDLFDHFVRNCEHGGSHVDPKGSRSLKIDRELELC
jgi:hypothetical protein